LKEGAAARRAKIEEEEGRKEKNARSSDKSETL
jgi:hypothetical protein